jgi:hypothetical protein
MELDGHQVWFDIMDMIEGDPIQPTIDKYIGECDVMVLVWSKSALKSTGVHKEIITAQNQNKRIIPVLIDNTHLHQKNELDGLLGVPCQEQEIGSLLLRRALLLLMISDDYKTSAWFAKGFDNVKDLGGYLKYVQTYRLPNNKNEDGHREYLIELLTKLTAENEFIRDNMLKKTGEDINKLQQIMAELEKGNNSKVQLQDWLNWCTQNENAQTEMMQKLIAFIQKDIERLEAGGAPVRVLNTNIIDDEVVRLEKAVLSGKTVAEKNISEKINKFSFGLLGASTSNTISAGLMNYVVQAPKVLSELSKEANYSEYVAVKESLVTVAHYLQHQDHDAEAQKQNLEGYFDDAYLINNTAKLLIESGLIQQNKISLDFLSSNVTDMYFALIIPTATKQKIDNVLQEIRNIIGLKKKEINWGTIAAVVVGGIIVANGVSAVSNMFDSDSGGSNSSSGGTFEDKVSEFTGKYGGGLSDYNNISY